MRNIKNQCVDLFSSLIECFGDLAVSSILQIIQNLLDATIISPEALDLKKQDSEEGKEDE